MNDRKSGDTRADEDPPQQVSAGVLDLLRGRFPGHTMQRVRTPDGRYRYSFVSPGVRETFGLDPDELVRDEGVSHDWLPPKDRKQFIDALEESARTLEPLDEEVRVLLPGGSYRWVRSIGHPRREPDGTVIWDGVALDVTDRREATEALARALSVARENEMSSQAMIDVATRDLTEPFEALRVAVRSAQEISGKTRFKRSQIQDTVQRLATAFDSFERAYHAMRGVVATGANGEDKAAASAADPATVASVPDLTPRQNEVLALIKDGLSNREIASALDIREGTVKLHVSAIIKSLGVSNRTAAARVVVRD